MIHGDLSESKDTVGVVYPFIAFDAHCVLFP